MAHDVVTRAPAPATGSEAARAPGRHRRRAAVAAPPGRSWPRTLALALGVGTLALIARLFRINTVYEIHIDEISYAEVARNLALGEKLLIYGTPFHLHPAGYFALLAAVQRSLGIEPDLLGAVMQLRPVGAVLGAATCVVVALMLRRLAGVVAAVLGGTYLALDPFANRFDSRLFLEAPAMLMAATAISCLTAASAARIAGSNSGGTSSSGITGDPDTATPGTPGPRGRLLVGAGLAVGGAILCKEPYALITAAPLVVLLVTGWALRRRDALTVLGVASFCYAGYVAGIVATGQWGPWQREKLSGVRRLLGLDQTTGYNAAGGGQLREELLDHALELGPTYLVVTVSALGLLVWLIAVIADRRRWAHAGPSVVVMVWLAVAGGYLSFAVLFGTLEEQTFYLVLTPAVTASAVLAAWAWRGGPAAHGAVDRVARAARVAVVALVALAMVGAGAAWTSIHTATDDGYATLVPWVEANVPDGARVAVTEDAAQFLLHGVDITTAGSVPELVARHADYLMVSTSLAEHGFGIARPSLLRELDGRAPVVFSHSGDGLGQLRLYDVRGITGGSGAAPLPLQDSDPPADDATVSAPQPATEDTP